MPIGLQEMHPAMVHFPIAFLPLSLGADALGRLTGDYALLEMGRRTMPLAAASAVTAAAFGLIAQQAVHAKGRAHDLLVTHRTLNAGLVGITAAMAARRMRTHRPGLGYLAVGLAALAAMGYSAARESAAGELAPALASPDRAFDEPEIHAVPPRW